MVLARPRRAVPAERIRRERPGQLRGRRGGHRAARCQLPVTRLSLVKYCGASGDFNVIHWNERIARAVGLPDVIAHGMFTMAQAGRFVTDWAGPQATVAEFGVRFSSMVVVPDDDSGASIEVSGQVEEKLADNRVAIALTARPPIPRC